MIALAAVVLALPSLITVSALTITNPSLLLPNSTIVDANYAYQCSGDSQGRNLDSASCMEALGQIDASSTPQKTWGQRGTGAFDVKLPKRYTSCSSSLPLIVLQKPPKKKTSSGLINSLSQRQQTDSVSSSPASSPDLSPEQVSKKSPAPRAPS